MAGGIFWRLAQDVVSEKAVTCGPSTSVLVDELVLGSIKRFHLIDNTLFLSEMDIICRVYFVESKFYLLILLCRTCLPLLQKLQTRIYDCCGG